MLTDFASQASGAEMSRGNGRSDDVLRAKLQQAQCQTTSLSLIAMCTTKTNKPSVRNRAQQRATSVGPVYQLPIAELALRAAVPRPTALQQQLRGPETVHCATFLRLHAPPGPGAQPS